MAKSIYINQTPIVQDKKFTFLSEDVNAGATTFGFKSSVGLNSLTTSSGQILMFGELGQEKTEVIKISAVSTSTGSNIGGTSATLATSLRFEHPQDTKVYFIDWDRFEVQHASTVTGTKSTITTSGADYPSALQPDQIEAIYRDTTQSAGFYFVRFNETISSTNSDWSDPIPFAGFDDNSVFAIKQRALESINEKIDGDVITDEFLNRALWEGRREYHQMPGKRPFRRRFNRDIGNALTGSFRIALPDDVEKPHTAENVYGVRIGTERNMHYIDKKEWDFHYYNVPHSTLELPYTVDVSTSIWVADGRDFSGTGAISVEGTNISIDRISGENNSFNISSHGDWSASAGSDVWENVSYGLPDKFTVWENIGGSSYIYFNRPIDTLYVKQNIYADYYRKVVELQTDYDNLDEPHYDIFVPYLAWRIKKKKNPELRDIEDSDFQRWQIMKQQAHDGEYAGTEIRLNPEIDHLL